MAYKQHIFIFSNSEGKKVQDHGAGRYGIWWKSVFPEPAAFSLWPHTAEGDKLALQGRFHKDINPNYEDRPHDCVISQRPPSSYYHYL